MSAAPADAAVEVLDRQSPRKRRRGAAAREAAARRPADVRRLLDLRVRGGEHRLADRDHRLGLDPRPEGPRLVALHRRRALLQQHPPVERGAVLLRDGRAPVGQVLDGRLARRPRAACGSPARSPSWWRCRRRSPATSPSRTSTRSGSPRRPRTRSTRSGSARSSTSPTSARCTATTSCCCRSRSSLLVARTCCSCAATASCRRSSSRRSSRPHVPRGPRWRRLRAGAERGAVMSFFAPRTTPGPGRARYQPYDLIKELCIAVGVIGLLAVVLTVLFSSPDDKPSTIAQWSHELPADFATAAAKELDGTSGTAEYGPPYNHNGEGQHAAFLLPAEMARRQPSDQHGRRLRDQTAGNDPQRPRAAERARRIQGRARKAEKGMGRSLRQAA